METEEYYGGYYPEPLEEKEEYKKITEEEEFNFIDELNDMIKIGEMY